MPLKEPSRGLRAFAYKKLDGVSVIVPNGSLEAYTKDRNWGNWPIYEMDQYTFNFVTIPNKINELLTVAQTAKYPPSIVYKRITIVPKTNPT